MIQPTNTVIKLSSPETKEFWPVTVLWEDDHLLVLDKPRDLPVSPDRSDPVRPSLMKLLHRDIARGAAWARARQLAYLSNAHRLEAEVGGVLLLVKNKPALTALADQFGSGQTDSSFDALVQGVPREAVFEVDAKLAPDPVTSGAMRVVDTRHGKRAGTRFEIRERFSGYALLNCRPSIARTHQVRVHLRHAGFPVVGDAMYGGAPLWLSKLKPGYRLKPGREERPLIRNVALHAEKLVIAHPATGVPVIILAPRPKELTVAVKYLRRFTSVASMMGQQTDQTPAQCDGYNQQRAAGEL